MRTSTDVRGRRSAGRGDRDGRLRIAALTNGRAVVRVLDSASLRTDAGPSPSGLQGRIYLGQNVSEHDVAPVTPILSADGERQSLYFAHAMCTDRNLVAGVARARLPYRLQTWFPEWTQLGVHVARGLEPRRRRRG